MSGFAKAPRPQRAADPDNIARALRAFDEAATRRAAENPIFREPERVTPTPLGVKVATVLLGVLAAAVVYVVWCGMYALLGGAL